MCPVWQHLMYGHQCCSGIGLIDAYSNRWAFAGGVTLLTSLPSICFPGSLWLARRPKHSWQGPVLPITMLSPSVTSTTRGECQYKEKCNFRHVCMIPGCEQPHPATQHATANKANLRDWIAATGLAISNWIQIVNFYRPCDREFWWMTLKNNRTLFLYYVKLCASFQIHWWNQTGFTIQKRSIWVEIGEILSLWPWNLMDDLGKQ